MIVLNPPLRSVTATQEATMTAPTFFTAILALCALALAVAMSFTSAGDLEKAGFWLLAAVASGLCVLIHTEETRPRAA